MTRKRFFNPPPDTPPKIKGTDTDEAQGRDRAFDEKCQLLGLPMPVKDYEFAPGFRFLFAWDGEEVGLVVEANNGIYPRVIVNAAVCAGWRCLVVQRSEIESGVVFNLIKKALEG